VPDDVAARLLHFGQNNERTVVFVPVEKCIISGADQVLQIPDDLVGVEHQPLKAGAYKVRILGRL
jgi:hypothetical protein